MVLRCLNRDRLAAETAKIIGRDLADQPPVIMRQLRALAAHDATARLGELAGIPTLVLSATHDRIARPEYGRTLAGAIPGAIYELQPDASHGMIIQQADRINRRLIQFLSSVERTRGKDRTERPSLP